VPDKVLQLLTQRLRTVLYPAGFHETTNCPPRTAHYPLPCNQSGMVTLLETLRASAGRRRTRFTPVLPANDGRWPRWPG